MSTTASENDASSQSSSSLESMPFKFKAVLNGSAHSHWLDVTNSADVNDEGPIRGNMAFEVESRENNVQRLLDIAETDTSDVIPDWAMEFVKVRFYVVRDGEIDFKTQVGRHIRVAGKDAMTIYMKQMSNLRLSRVHHFAQLGEYMHNLNKQQKLMDCIVRVNDQIFAANRHVLSCHSGFFASLFINNTVPAYAVTDVTLYDITSEAFAHFIHFVHIGDVHLNPDNVSTLLDLSSKLQSENLRAQILIYMSRTNNLSVPKAVQILKDPSKEHMRPEAIATLIHRFKELIDYPQYLKNIDKDAFAEIISSETVTINTELDVFWAVLYWTAQDNRGEHLAELMRYVRFSTMSTLELMDCARALRAIGFADSCQDLLVEANWIAYNREKGIVDPLRMDAEFPRMTLHDAPHFEPSVYEFDLRFIMYKKLDTGIPLADEENKPVTFDMLGMKEGLIPKDKKVHFNDTIDYSGVETRPYYDEDEEEEGSTDDMDDNDAISQDTESAPTITSTNLEDLIEDVRLARKSSSDAMMNGSNNESASASSKGTNGDRLPPEDQRRDEEDANQSKSPNMAQVLNRHPSNHTSGYYYKEFVNGDDASEVMSYSNIIDDNHPNTIGSRYERDTVIDSISSSEAYSVKNVNEGDEMGRIMARSDESSDNVIANSRKSLTMLPYRSKASAIPRDTRDTTELEDARAYPQNTSDTSDISDLTELEDDIGATTKNTGGLGGRDDNDAQEELDGNCNINAPYPIVATKTAIQVHYHPMEHSQGTCSSLSLLDRPEVEMNLIPPPMIQPEATSVWRVVLPDANNKRKLL